MNLKSEDNNSIIESLKTILDSPMTELAVCIFDALQKAPFGDVFVSCFKTVLGISDYLLIRRIARFLEPMRGRKDDVNGFLHRLTPAKRGMLGEYLLSLLSKSESVEKARIMGFIFKYAVNGHIDYEMMLRLVSIVENSFVADLKHLPEYVEELEIFTIATNGFVNLGLIDNETGGYWKPNPAVQLNEMGRVLFAI